MTRSRDLAVLASDAKESRATEANVPAEAEENPEGEPEGEPAAAEGERARAIAVTQQAAVALNRY